MKTEQIRLALAIAQEKSISKAAAALFISQPTASNLLKTLEKEIGYSIFQRKRNGVTLTKEGAAFIEQAGNIERALRTISQVRHGVEHIELTVLSYHLDFSALAFEKMCEQYHSESYAAKLQYRVVGDTENMARMLAAGYGDVAVVMCLKCLFDAYRQNFAKSALETMPISESQMMLTCNADHPIIRGGAIDYSLLGMYPGFSGVQRAVTEPYASFYLPKLVGKARTMIVMDPGPIRYRLLQKTNGFLISMPLPAEIKAEYGFDSLPIEDSDVMIFAMYRKDRSNQRLIDEYINYCFKYI